MSETTTQRTARLLSMSNADLIMHAQDLTLERDTLREELAEARQEIADRKADCETGHDQDEATIAELRQQLAEKDAEIDGIKGGMVYRNSLLCRIETERDELRQQLAASPAREQQLREATECLLHLCEIIDAPDGPVLDKARQALAQPQDTAALQSMITKAGEVMRERCAVRADWFTPFVGGKIRALPAVTLDDLKGGA